MAFALFVIARLAVIAFSLLAFIYALLNCSPFAFDMFIKPQLFPWVTTFVAWHHLWFGAAYLVSLGTLHSELSWRRARHGSSKAAHWTAIGYVLVFGMVAVMLVRRPLLPTLWNDARALPAALAALLPLVWLAMIDHLASRERDLSGTAMPAAVTGQRRLLATCGATALYIAAVHLARSLAHEADAGSRLAWMVAAAWALLLTAATFGGLFVLLSFVSGLAARSASARRLEYSLLVALAAAGLSELLRRGFFPTVSLTPGDAATLGAAAAVTIVTTWSGLMLRRPAVERGDARTAMEILLAPSGGALATVAAAIALSVCSVVALDYIERRDWHTVGQRTIVLFECVVAFGLMLRLTRRLDESTRRPRTLFVAPVLTLGALVAAPTAASRIAGWTADPSLEPAMAFERHAARDIAFRLMSEVLIARSGFEDPGYHQFLQRHASAGTGPIHVPDTEFSAPPVRAVHSSRPDIFVFVIDSLRRDYLSPYNAAVAFTPNIGAFAAENFAFKNAFTRHGGTELAMASIWAGATAVRKVRANHFARMNALEKFVNANGYRMAINDFTIAEHLKPTTPKATIDPGIRSVDTDLCRNLQSVQTHLDETRDDPRPVFGYLAPMNVHILNTQRGGQPSLDGDYPGFYAPYASRVKRMDGCFGSFIAYLKERDRYDDSIIVLTSDHGDSLGEDGHWGHAMWLYPEDVRLPLIIRIPEAMKPRLTTDLARLVFSTDIAPTLYVLLDQPVQDLGPLFGAPLFVRSGAAMRDRRKDSFLLTSSYGAILGLLRRNGRLLYISNLVEWRESAYDLSTSQLGSPVHVDSALRSVSQRHIREQLTAVADLYGFSR